MGHIWAQKSDLGCFSLQCECIFTNCDTGEIGIGLHLILLKILHQRWDVIKDDVMRMFIYYDYTALFISSKFPLEIKWSLI